MVQYNRCWKARPHDIGMIEAGDEKMNRLEAMTRHVMIRSGVDHNDIPLLLDAALHGHGPSRRLLERAAGDEIVIRVPGMDGLCPLEYASEHERRRGFVYARIAIGSFAWEDDTLHGQLPETLRIAIVGRPLRDIIDADFIPPGHMTRKAESGALLSFDRLGVDMPRPTLAQRIAWLPRRWRLSIAEGMVDGPKPRWSIVTMSLMTLTTGMLAVLAAMDPTRHGVADWIATSALAIASLNGIWFVANGMRRRQFSLLHAMMAQSFHTSRKSPWRHDRTA